MTFQQLVSRLSSIYESHEARSIIRLLLEDGYGLPFTDVCLGALDTLSVEDKDRLEVMMQRLESGEPVQYVLGSTVFCGREIKVEHGVLIPRPETEELVEWVIAEMPEIRGDRNCKKYILDIGCGSGCISVNLAAELGPEIEVSAWDISDTALRLTRNNARLHNVKVDIYMQDALSAPSGDSEVWSVIVSNPPYICSKEAKDMESHVLNHEPHEALFVPDSDPLLFYRAIAEYASHALMPGGRLFFEINESYGKETVSMLCSMGYENVEMKCDQFGKDRMVRACVRTQK